MTTLFTPVLDYTPRDWSRWDTFDLRRYTKTTRSSHGLQTTPLTVAGATANYSATYYHMFRQEYLTNFYAYDRQAFLWLQKPPSLKDDYIHILRTTRELNPLSVNNRMSYALTHEYNTYRVTQRDAIRHTLKAAMVAAGTLPADSTVLLDDQANAAFDKLEPDFRSLPAFQPHIKFLTELLHLHLDQQCLDPTFTVKTWKPFGIWQKADGSFDQGRLWWSTADYSFLYARYLHLLDNDLIRRIRLSARAVLGALWQIYSQSAAAQGDPNVGNWQAMESQWLLRIQGWTGYTFLLERSEDELRRRGVWGAATADLLYEDTAPEAIALRAANREAGQWSQQEALTQAEIFAGQLADRMATMGQTEFLGSYTRFHLDLTAQWLLHCPNSQKLYNMGMAVWHRIQWDLIVNYHPASASFPAPASRSYDLFAGTHNYHDRMDQYLYYKHVFANGAKPDALLRELSTTEKLRATLLIDSGLYLLPPRYDDLVHSFARNFYAAAQLSGEGMLPQQLLQDLVIKSPNRINEQRFSTVSGQERYNFVTPSYTMGHCGENLSLLAITCPLACRISGGKPPTPNAPLMIAYNGASPASSYIRLLAETNGNPFVRTGNKPLAPAADNIARLVRSVVSQYQGFMLVTHLFAPTPATTSTELTTAAWSSNLMLPLAVDKLMLSNGTVLPLVSGTKVTIPADHMVFTVQHGNAAIVVRIASFDRSDDVAVVWQVDDASISCGVGRVTITHRAAGTGTPLKPFKVVWLFGSGTFASQSELTALRDIIYYAPVLQTTAVAEGVWDERNQPANGSYPTGSPAAPIGEVGSRRWTVNATIGQLRLGVDRTDVYLPWRQSPMYSLPRKSPLHAAPYFSRNVTRSVNGRKILEWVAGEDPYRTLRVADNEVFAPHRANYAAPMFPTTWVHATN